MRNRPEVLEAMFACFKAGFCLVPLNSRFTSEEVAFHVERLAGAGPSSPTRRARRWSRGAGCADVTVVVAGGSRSGAGALDHEHLVAEHDAVAGLGRRRPRRPGLALLHVGHDRAAQGGDAEPRHLGLRHRVVAGRHHPDGRA